jgi:hypothetical protein
MGAMGSDGGRVSTGSDENNLSPILELSGAPPPANRNFVEQRVSVLRECTTARLLYTYIF